MNQAIEEWAKFLIDVWISRMYQLDVRNAIFHAEAFEHFVISSAAGDPLKVEFAFDYFLKFTDMGVGNGISIQKRKNFTTNRVQKMWYTKTWLLEVKKLANILAAKYAYKGILTVVENVNDNALRWKKSWITQSI